MSGPTRREVLVGAGLLGAAGLGLRVGPVEAGSTSSSGPESETELPDVLVSRDAVVRRPGTRPGTRPEPGTAALPQGTLETEGGQTVGRFDTARIESSGRPMHIQRLHIGSATLVALGESPHDGQFVLVGCSTGGLSAVGTYTIERDDQGDYRFSFDQKAEA